MSESKSFTQQMGKAAVVGGIGYFASAYLVGGEGTLPVPMIGEISSNTAVGLACAGGSIAGGIAAEYVIPMLPQSESMEEVEAATIKPLTTGACVYMAGRMMGEVPNPLMLVAFGAASEVAGEYAFNGYVAPMLA